MATEHSEDREDDLADEALDRGAGNGRFGCWACGCFRP